MSGWLDTRDDQQAQELKLGTLITVVVYCYVGQEGCFRCRVNNQVDFNPETTSERTYLTIEEAKAVGIAKAQSLLEESQQDLVGSYLKLKLC